MSVTKSLFLGFLLLLLSYLLFTPKTPHQSKGSEMLYANPYIFRALNPHSYTLSADFLWLKAQYVSEMRIKYSNINTTQFFEAFKTIAIMDSNFFAAINYGAIFLASMQKEIDLAESIADEALKFSPNNIELLFLKLILNVSYKESKDEQLIYNLAKKIATNKDAPKFMNSQMIKSYAQDMLLFSKNRVLTKAQRLQDLKWLRENTEDATRKKEIEKKILATINE